jgi:hypothetical protein
MPNKLLEFEMLEQHGQHKCSVIFIVRKNITRNIFEYAAGMKQIQFFRNTGLMAIII